MSAQPPQWSQQQRPQQPPPRQHASRQVQPPQTQPLRRGRVALAATLSVVAMIACASLVTWAAFAAAKERERVAALPSPTPYSVPKAADPTTPPPAGVLEKLPDMCAKLQAALPAELRPGVGDHSTKTNDEERQNCRWRSLDKRAATYFAIDVLVFPDRDPEVATATASQELAEEKDYSSNTEDNGGFHKNVKDITDVGDEAFGDESSNIIKLDEINYFVAGAHLFVRSGNVTIEINWLGATYPKSQNVKALKGTNLTYDQALPQAKRIAETVIEQLK